MWKMVHSCPGVVIFRQNDLFLGVGAAHGRAIAVFARGDPPGTDALNPGDLVRMLHVGGTQDLPCVRSRGAQEPLVVHAGDHVRELPVVVFLLGLGVKGLKARSQNDRPYTDLFLLRCLLQVDGVVLANSFADAALVLFEIETALIDIGDQGDGLGEVDVNGFVLRYLLVVLIRVFGRAVLHTGGTARAFVLQNVPGLLDQRDLEVSHLAFYTRSTSVYVRTSMFGCRPTSTSLGARIHMEQSLVGKVLSSCAMWPPMLGAFSTR